MPSEDQIRSTVEQYLAAVGGGTAAEVAALYAEDGTLEDPVGSEVRRGREAVAGFYAALEDLDISTRLEELRVAGNEATFLFEVATKVGDSAHIVRPIDHMTFDDEGRILTMRAFWSQSDYRTR